MNAGSGPSGDYTLINNDEAINISGGSDHTVTQNNQTISHSLPPGASVSLPIPQGERKTKSGEIHEGGPCGSKQVREIMDGDANQGTSGPSPGPSTQIHTTNNAPSINSQANKGCPITQNVYVNQAVHTDEPALAKQKWGNIMALQVGEVVDRESAEGWTRCPVGVWEGHQSWKDGRIQVGHKVLYSERFRHYEIPLTKGEVTPYHVDFTTSHSSTKISGILYHDFWDNKTGAEGKISKGGVNNNYLKFEVTPQYKIVPLLGEFPRGCDSKLVILGCEVGP